MDARSSITINNAPIVWDPAVGDVSFFGISSVLFWANPSMFRMLEPLVEEIGVDLFRMLVAHSSSLGTEEDYHSMVTVLGSTFPEGFLAWGRAVSAAVGSCACKKRAEGFGAVRSYKAKSLAFSRMRSGNVAGLMKTSTWIPTRRW
jgi:hypothetical protein